MRLAFSEAFTGNPGLSGFANVMQASCAAFVEQIYASRKSK
jgi:hypothetical protein